MMRKVAEALPAAAMACSIACETFLVSSSAEMALTRKAAETSWIGFSAG